MLDDTDRAVLEFAKRRYVHAGARVTAIRDELGVSETRYAQMLVRLLRDPAAEAAEPMLVHRLRRLMESRVAQRVATLRLY